MNHVEPDGENLSEKFMAKTKPMPTAVSDTSARALQIDEIIALTGFLFGQ